MARLPYLCECDQRLGIFDGVALHVVVEVNEDIELLMAPSDYTFGPRLQSSLAVAEPAWRQMHPYICEVARDLERLRHLGVVGNTKGDAMRPQQAEYGGHEPGVVPEFQCEAPVGWQQANEALKAREVEVEVRLELKEDRTKLGVEPAGRVDNQVDRFRLDRQTLDMGDVATALDGEEEARWRLLRPANKTLPRRLPIEGVIELDRVEVLGVEGEVLARRELLGIEALTPVRIRPSGTADTDLACH